MIKNLSDFRSPSTIKPELNAILVTPDAIVATDTFKLIEMRKLTGAIKRHLVQLPKGVKTFDTITYKNDLVGTMIDGNFVELGTPLDPDKYPQYERVLPTEKPLKTIRLNVEYLKQIMTAFETKGRNKIDMVDISFYEKPYSPVMFERVPAPTKRDTDNEPVTILLMPINNDR